MKKQLIKLLNLNSTKAYTIYTFVSILYLIIIALKIGLNSPFWHDEKHFYEAILFFSNNNLFNAIKDYPEVTTPLFYVFFALIGKIVGFSIEALRIINLSIAFITFQLLFLFLKSIIQRPVIVLAICGIVLINPYVIGASIFLYTDMFALMFFFLALYGLFSNNKWFYFFGTTLAILSRQYYVFLPLAVLVYYLILFFRHDSKRFTESLFVGKWYPILSIISIFPLILLMIIWGGSAPKSGIEIWNPGNSMAYNFSYITSYLVMLGVYAFPFLLYYLIKTAAVRDLIIALLLSVYYFFYPVEPSLVSVKMVKLDTIGFAHILIKKITYFAFIEHFIFYLFFVIVLTELTGMIRKKYSKRDFQLMLFLILLSFILIMPVSYQVWEKYLLPVIPVFSALLICSVSLIKEKPILSDSRADVSVSSTIVK